MVALLSQFDLLSFYGLFLAALGLRKIAKTIVLARVGSHSHLLHYSRSSRYCGVPQSLEAETRERRNAYPYFTRIATINWIEPAAFHAGHNRRSCDADRWRKIPAAAPKGYVERHESVSPPTIRNQPRARP